MLNISEIVQNKINSMIENETLKKEIENTIEKEIISQIRDSISCYDVRDIFGKKIKQEVSETIEQISFKGYANLVVEQIKQAVNANAQKILTDEVMQYFNDLYLPNEDKVLTVKELFNKYTEMAKNSLEDTSEEVYSYMNVQKYKPSFLTYSKWVKIFVSLNDEYKEEDSKTYEIELLNISGEENKYKIVSIYEEKRRTKDLTERLKFGYLDSFERFLMRAYFNKTVFEIKESDFDTYENLVYSWD